MQGIVLNYFYHPLVMFIIVVNQSIIIIYSNFSINNTRYQTMGSANLQIKSGIVNVDMNPYVNAIFCFR
jgi:hypothetical protein